MKNANNTYKDLTFSLFALGMSFLRLAMVTSARPPFFWSAGSMYFMQTVAPILSRFSSWRRLSWVPTRIFISSAPVEDFHEFFFPAFFMFWPVFHCLQQNKAILRMSILIKKQSTFMSSDQDGILHCKPCLGEIEQYNYNVSLLALLWSFRNLGVQMWEEKFTKAEQ